MSKEENKFDSYHPVYHYKIRGEYNPPEKLGIHGDKITVDLDRCIGDQCYESGFTPYSLDNEEEVTQRSCVDSCPPGAFKWEMFEGHPTSTRKAIPVIQNQCSDCRVCETNCPVGAITVHV